MEKPKAKTTLELSLKLLKRLQDLDHQSWGAESSLRQGYDPKQAHGEVIAAAEEMVNSAIISGTIRALIRSYKSLNEHSKLPKVINQRASRGNHQINSVFPYDLVDRLQPFALAGIKGEVWSNGCEAIQELKNLGQVSLVLGAGNQSFLAFGDIMHEMFVKGNVTILKHHPVRDFCAPYYDALFIDLIEDGFFVSTLGDLELSSWLCKHELIESIHITGGTATHDVIMWGNTLEEQTINKSNNTPVLSKPMTSELGCVTPWLVCSGVEWTEQELKRHASHLAKAFVSQNSCNCLSPKLIVLDEDWPQCDEFISYLREQLKTVKSPPPYYPGSQERFNKFIRAYPNEALELIQTSSGIIKGSSI